MTNGKTIALTRQTFVGKVMSLLFNMLSRLVITFLPRSKHLLISWLQSLSAVILDILALEAREARGGHPCLISDLSWKVLSFSALSLMLAVGFFGEKEKEGFIKLRKLPSIPCLLRILVIKLCYAVCCTVLSHFSRVRLCETPWTAAR